MVKLVQNVECDFYPDVCYPIDSDFKAKLLAKLKIAQ